MQKSVSLTFVVPFFLGCLICILHSLRFVSFFAIFQLTFYQSVMFVFCCIFRICVCGSIYLIMAVGVERYLAVCRPHHYREQQGRPNRSLYYILPALVTAICVNIPRFFEIEPHVYCEDYSGCGIPLVKEQ